MDNEVDRVKERLARPAAVIEPSDGVAVELTSSRLGSVSVALPGEKWPVANRVPMFPIAQLNLRDAPFVPRILNDVTLITLFFSEPVLTEEGENGGNWVLRSYPHLEPLVPLEADLSTTRMQFSNVVWKPATVRYRFLQSDYPDLYGIPPGVAIPEPILDQWSSLVVPCESSKVGGWPYLLQTALEWPVDLDLKPEFVFQLASLGNPEFPFCDMIYYVGRVRGRLPSEWILTSQSI
jgi:hypothetical protein